MPKNDISDIIIFLKKWAWPRPRGLIQKSLRAKLILYGWATTCNMRNCMGRKIKCAGHTDTQTHRHTDESDLI